MLLLLHYYILILYALLLVISPLSLVMISHFDLYNYFTLVLIVL